MTVTIAINGEPIHTVTIVNRGPVGGRYQGTDHAGGAGPREYDWWTDGRNDGRQPSQQSGCLVHERGDGAVALAARVLADLDNELRPDRVPPPPPDPGVTESVGRPGSTPLRYGA